MWERSVFRGWHKNTPAQKDGDDLITNKTPWIIVKKTSQSPVTYTARAQVLNLSQIILSYSSQWIFVIQGLDFSNSVALWEEDLTLTVGVADISPPEVIIIHSQSQYRCVVKTRTVLTSIHPSCRDSHVSASVGQWQFFCHGTSPLQMAAILPGKVRRPSIWLITSCMCVSW